MKDTQDLSWAEALREADRLRAELAKKNELVQFFIDLATKCGWNGTDNSKILTVFWLTFVDDLRTELAKAQDATAAWVALCSQTQEQLRLQIDHSEAAEDRCKELEELTDRQSAELTAQAAEADKRIKELELALSSKTFSYDPDSERKGFIAGIEEAAGLLEYNSCACEKRIRARIEELKNEEVS